jgi:hypothetical protein
MFPALAMTKRKVLAYHCEVFAFFFSSAQVHWHPQVLRFADRSPLSDLLRRISADFLLDRDIAHLFLQA